eukprot:TRINITY_DN2330_c0_g1_i1.p1 TRINITY_DN2330_c0_g1~~TRINITY_DN2330_c0_g1_i1.p1  ORF type:complete len:603 (-),score=147.73 TRINITY_DN2330_c0_g1_i1:163-1971(-)
MNCGESKDSPCSSISVALEQLKNNSKEIQFVLLPGVYSGYDNINVTIKYSNNIILQSDSTNPEDTVIDCGGLGDGENCLNLFLNETIFRAPQYKLTIKDLTMRNYSYESQYYYTFGGSIISNFGGILNVDNVLFTQNSKCDLIILQGIVGLSVNEVQFVSNNDIGGIVAETGVDTNITNSIFRDNKLESYLISSTSVILNNTNVPITRISGCTFENNELIRQGHDLISILYSTSYNPNLLIIEDTTFRNNSITKGHSIIASQDYSQDFTKVTFTDNYCESIILQKTTHNAGTTNYNNVVLENNVCTSHCVSLTNSTGVIDGLEIKDSPTIGSGLFLNYPKGILIKNTKLVNNTCIGNIDFTGAPNTNYSSAVIILNDDINFDFKYQGENDFSIFFDNLYMENNYGYSAGAMYVETNLDFFGTFTNFTMNIANSKFINNHALHNINNSYTGNGGAITLVGNDFITFDNIDFSKNTADIDGGAFYCTSLNSKFDAVLYFANTPSKFTDNNAVSNNNTNTSANNPNDPCIFKCKDITQDGFCVESDSSSGSGSSSSNNIALEVTSAIIAIVIVGGLFIGGFVVAFYVYRTRFRNKSIDESDPLVN